MQMASCRMISYSSQKPGRRWAVWPERSTACSSSAALTKLPQELPWYSAALAALQRSKQLWPGADSYLCLRCVNTCRCLAWPRNC